MCVYPLESQGCRIVFLNLSIAGERGMIVGPHSTKLSQSWDTESDQLGANSSWALLVTRTRFPAIAHLFASAVTHLILLLSLQFELGGEGSHLVCCLPGTLVFSLRLASCKPLSVQYANS